MENIEIGRPRIEDIELINEFFELVIKDTFERNDIADLVDTIEREIKSKKSYLQQDLESEGKNRFFLIAKDGHKIVGSIELGPPNALILECTNGEYMNLLEIGTVFVHPDYQSKGIGTRMLKLLSSELTKKGIKEFCLDSGYKTAQKTWKRKLGTPAYHMKDYWGEGADHMIWRVRIEKVLL